MTPLKKGDKCPVRRHTGEVVEAEYHSQDPNRKKFHFVLMCDGYLALAWKYEPMAGDEFSYEAVRFVGNPCVLVPVGVSV